MEALEQRAALDPNRLPRGRGYARSGNVMDLEVTPGVVRAGVQGSRAKPYSVTVRVRAFDADEWGRVLDVVAAQLGRSAALLDGELPPELVQDVAAAGLDLLPGPGEVQPRCSCPDWADPCKHSAAVCYLVADELDADPFALLRLRGRDRDQVLAALRARRSRPGAGSATAPAARPVDAGLRARDALLRPVAELPSIPLPPGRPGRPAVLSVEPPPGSGITADDLVDVAADAIRRAWQLATGDGDGGVGLDRDADLARRAADLLDGRAPAPRLASLARAAGLPVRELTSWAVAWRVGGSGGLAALRETRQPSAGSWPVAVRRWRPSRAPDRCGCSGTGSPGAGCSCGSAPTAGGIGSSGTGRPGTWRVRGPSTRRPEDAGGTWSS